MVEKRRVAHLYIGTSPSRLTPSTFPHFNSDETIPISWFLLFSQKHLIRRKDLSAESMTEFEESTDLDYFAQSN